MPRYLEPMKATLATKPFRDEDWLFEIKWDGYRVEAVVRDGKVAPVHAQRPRRRDLLPAPADPADLDRGRARRSWTARWSRSTSAGRPDFGAAPGADQRGAERIAASPLVFQAFDLLYLDGRSLLDVPLEDRKKLLELVLRPIDPCPVRAGDRDRGDRVLRGGQGPGARGDRGQAPPLPLRAGPARRRPGSRSRSGRSRSWSSAAGRRGRGPRRSSVPSWSGSTRASGCGSPARWARGSTARTRQGPAGAPRGPRDRRARRSTPRRRRTTRAAGAATSPASAGSGRSWSSGRRPAAGLATGTSARSAYKGLEPGRDPREVVRERAVDPAKAEREAESTLIERSIAPSVMTIASSGERDQATEQAVDPAWLVSDAELDALDRLKADGVWHVGGPGSAAHEPRQGPLPAA